MAASIFCSRLLAAATLRSHPPRRALGAAAQVRSPAGSCWEGRWEEGRGGRLGPGGSGGKGSEAQLTSVTLADTGCPAGSAGGPPGTASRFLSASLGSGPPSVSGPATRLPLLPQARGGGGRPGWGPRASAGGRAVPFCSSRSCEAGRGSRGPHWGGGRALQMHSVLPGGCRRWGPRCLRTALLGRGREVRRSLPRAVGQRPPCLLLWQRDDVSRVTSGGSKKTVFGVPSFLDTL